MEWGLGIGDWAQSPIPNPQFNINLDLNKYYFNRFNLKLFIQILKLFIQDLI